VNDDEYGALLLRPLRGEPAGTARLDVAKAMRDGRRRRRTRWWTGGSALAATVTALVTGSLLLSPAQQDNPPRPDLPPDPPVPTTCTVDRLPLGDSPAGELSAGDPSGRWHAGFTWPLPGIPPDRATDRKLLVWHDGKLVTGIKNDGRGVTLTDLNSAGAGVGYLDTGRDVPYLYRDKKLTPLKGGQGQAIAINDAGTIAGVLGPDNRHRPARWASPGAEPTLLAVPGPMEGVKIMDIAPDGTVLGLVGSAAYRWLPDGTAEQLRPPRLSAVVGPPSPGAPGPAQLYVEPVGFSFGWLYIVVSYSDSRDTDIYRYHARSDTWQNLGGWMDGAQLAAAGIAPHFGQDTPEIWVGRVPFPLPRHAPTVEAGVDSYSIKAVSDDVHVVAGTGMSGIADPSKPFLPMIWRCR
jgi:hypothetical protein